MTSLSSVQNEHLDRWWYPGLLLVLALGMWLRWPMPSPEWQHIDERAFIVHPLGFWSGDLNPHFFNYPTLHFYLASVLYYGYYLLADLGSVSEFVAYRYFVDGADLIGLVRGLNTILSSLTGVICALIARRLYGFWGGLWAGLLFAVLPISVRFAHFANVDVPLSLWSLIALFFSIRLVEEGRIRDAILAGISVGLATATKYPGILVFVPLGLACVLRFGWRGGAMWWSGLCVGGTFFICSPYVLVDWSMAVVSISAMGSEHLLSTAHGGMGSGLWHHLRYNLRYGIGLFGVLGLVAGLMVQIRSYRREEWVLLCGVMSWVVFLAVSSSVFMRYALPLAPLVVLLWIRGAVLLAQPLWVRWGLVLVLGAEPLYGAYQTRTLLGTEDTRIQAQHWLEENVPPGAYLIHLQHGAGRLKVVHPGSIYARQNHYRKYYTEEDLRRSYAHLAKHRDLPAFYISLDLRHGFDMVAEEFGQALSQGLLIDYQHPLIEAEQSAESKKLEMLSSWAVEFDPGAEQDAVFDSVDWYFAPIGSYAAVERTGPSLRLAIVPLLEGTRPIPMAKFFALLTDLMKAKNALEEGESALSLELYKKIWATPFSLDATLTPEFVFELLANMGLAHSLHGEHDESLKLWLKAIELKPEQADIHQRLGALYFDSDRHDEAIAAWQKVLDLEPSRVGTHYDLGRVLYAGKEYERAVAAWQQTIDLDPNFPEVYYNIGNALYQLRRYGLALGAYLKALDRDPQNREILSQVVRVQSEMGNGPEAIALLEKILVDGGPDTEVYYQLGDLYFQAGQWLKARTNFEQLLQRDPSYPNAGRVRHLLGELPISEGSLGDGASGRQ